MHGWMVEGYRQMDGWGGGVGEASMVCMHDAGEQIIILRMIYAYCLSLFSIHFFGSHSIANFKLRLINQQTGDCTDSVILHAGKLTPSTFPVPIKLKGGQRLLVKVKLISLPSQSTEALVGEGVVTFDKNSIDNTLRVPIYDKQRGVEEVAICSIDFFLSGFEVDKHHSINADKSRSRFDDLRERSDDAVYSQMSYTLESERDSADANNNSKPQPNISNVSAANGKQKTMEGEGLKSKAVKKKQMKQPQTIVVKAKQGKMLSARKQSPRIVNIQQEDEGSPREEPSRAKPFTLSANVYLQGKMPQSNKKTLKQTNKKPPSKLKKIFALESEEDVSRSEKNMELSPQNLRKTVKDNQEMLSRLKRLLTNYESQESPKHKRRRNKIKVEQFSTYKSQNIFLKYHVDVKQSSTKVIKNMRAIRIIENQIKQPSEEKVIPQMIDKIVLSSLNGGKLVTFDASGFRAYCISNGQKESVATIMVPTLQNAVKVQVHLGQEGDFQGVLGLQEGETMNINLVRLSASEESILQRSQFKLLFDIKASDLKPSTRIINYHNQDISYRQPYEVIAPDEDIKTRVGQFSCQPWGFIQSYAESVVLSAESKEVMNKIDQQLPRLKEQLKPKALSEPRTIRQPTPIKPRESPVKKDVQVKNPSASKEFLESPIQKLKPKPGNSHIRRETDSINSIRNGNRNNYRFQERTSSKQIKQAWQEILFKRKAEEDRKKQSYKQLKYTLKSSHPSAQKRYKTSSESQNESLSTFKPKKVHKIYEFAENDARRPVFPVRTFTLRIANASITQPQALVDLTNGLHVGKFVKFAIKGKTMYFTEVIFSGGYNSILWKLEGCIFEGLTGAERLKIEIYETLNNHITTLGISYIRVNRLHFLRNSHIYNGTISHDNTIFGEFTLGFEIEENCPFEVIREEDEDTIDVSGRPVASPQGKRLQPLSRQSQKNISRQLNRPFFTGLEDESDQSMMERGELQESMSMPMGLSRE